VASRHWPSSGTETMRPWSMLFENDIRDTDLIFPVFGFDFMKFGHRSLLCCDCKLSIGLFLAYPL